MSTETYGTHRANAYKILEDTLNLRDCRIYDTIEDARSRAACPEPEGDDACPAEAAGHQGYLCSWVWQDPQRRNLLVKQYNELFNSTRPREYDGSHIHFVGMNPEITLREHQRNAVAHVLYGGNTLLAHEVGAGKTFEMAASAMESKRLGLCQKSLFVVPNHLTEQWASEFLRYTPMQSCSLHAARTLNRQSQSVFAPASQPATTMPSLSATRSLSKSLCPSERQARIIQEQIDETHCSHQELKVHAASILPSSRWKRHGKRWSESWKKLRSDDRKDDVITFEQLGVDRLFVDESQIYKNLYLYTKMRNVAGLIYLRSTEVQRYVRQVSLSG